MPTPEEIERAAQNFGEAIAEDLTAGRNLSSQLTPAERRANDRAAEAAWYQRKKNQK